MNSVSEPQKKQILLIEETLLKFFKHYEVSTAKELAEKIGVSQQTISSWKQRESIGAIKKMCLKLGIYDFIFNKEENKNNFLSGNKMEQELEYRSNLLAAYGVFNILNKQIKDKFPMEPKDDGSDSLSSFEYDSMLQDATTEIFRFIGVYFDFDLFSKEINTNLALSYTPSSMYELFYEYRSVPYEEFEEIVIAIYADISQLFDLKKIALFSNSRAKP